MIYLDHNATTPVAPAVRIEIIDAIERAWANPSSTHGPGQAARRLLADSRTRVASYLGCSGAELVFTSGATEANHQALLGALAARAPERRRVVMSAVEHPGLLALGRRLQAQGVAVDLIPVDAEGRIDLDAAAALIGDDVAIVSVMGANNETGVVMPTAALAAIAQSRGAWLHVDATQLPGKSECSFAACGADLMSVSAHKIAGPKGTGALVVRKGIALPPLLAGRQERQRRGGTENLPGIAGFAAACDLARSTQADDIVRMAALRDMLESALLRELPEVHRYGAGAQRLANTSCLRFGELDADQVLGRLERAGVVASSGAACSAGGTEPSHVLLALGATPRQARAGVRFSLGRETTAQDIQAALDAVRRAIAPLLASTALAA